MNAIIDDRKRALGKVRVVPLAQAVGTVLAHDITEIRPGEFKGRAFRKGHIIREEDIGPLRRLGKESLFILDLTSEDIHEDEAAMALAAALCGDGAQVAGEPKEGKANLAASRSGLLKIDKEALLALNMMGEVMCATLHSNTLVKRGQVVAGTRAVPLVLKRRVVEQAVSLLKGKKIIEVKELRRPRAGVVITGNEVHCGRIKDAFAPVIRRKLEALGGEIAGLYYAPDDAEIIRQRLVLLLKAGADLLIATGGMSVDPDDVTRFAIRNLAENITYGSAALPGTMFLVAYITPPDEGGVVPILGIPACSMYNKTTVFDLILPRILAGERIGRTELAELGHGGLCLECKECRYPVCPFGK